MKVCQLCGGELGLLGQLGRLKWFVCRACGMQFSRQMRPLKKKTATTEPKAQGASSGN